MSSQIEAVNTSPRSALRVRLRLEAAMTHDPAIIDAAARAWKPFASAPTDGQIIQANRQIGKRDFQSPPSDFRFDVERSCWLQLVTGSWERALFTPTHWRAKAEQDEGEEPVYPAAPPSPELVEAMRHMALELQRRGLKP